MRYLKVLPRQLFKDYGHKGPYTPSQIDSSLERAGLASTRFVPYAIALFCNPAELRRLQDENGLACDYADVRRELSNAYFGGEPDFSPADVARYSAEHGSLAETGHGGHNSADGGGHHGGGGGGHH